MARNYSNPSDRGLKAVLTLIVVVILALGVFAVAKSGKISTTNKTASDTITLESKVSELADKQGYSADDFIKVASGLTDEDGITGDSTVSELLDKVSLEKYSQMALGEELTDDTLAEFKTAKGLGDDVTKDTTNTDVKDQYAEYISEKKAAEEEATAATDTTDGSVATEAAAE